jgi:dTDP-glucose 4,6-dehydratase
MMVNALAGRPLPVYGDGRQIRDWLYVEDHCVAIDRILQDGRPGATYNVGGRAEHVNIDIVGRICEMVDERFARDASLRSRFPDCPAAAGQVCASLITHVRDRPGHDRRYAIDPARVSGELGFEPAETLGSGLARTLDWFLDNEPWWRSILDGSYRSWIAEHYGM